MLVRLQHWCTRSFHDFLLQSASVPFKWGTWDCALFAADGIKAITGVDVAEDFRGRYNDEAGAFAAIKAVCGGESVADAAAYCAKKHGMAEWLNKEGNPLPLMARRGDLVVIQDAGRLIAGVIHLNGSSAVSVGEAGLKMLPLTSVTRAWHY